MKTWLVVAVLAALGAPGEAQEKTAATRSMPFEGEVSTERLSVRMFPKGDAQSIVTSYLTLGEKVVVVGELKVADTEYFQIKPPHGSTVWVSSRSVKKDGPSAQAIASDVPVRLDSRVNADQVASLKEGESVKVVAEHMGWFKIESPESVKYYVGKKYVKTPTGVVAAVQPRAPDDPAKRAARPEPRPEDADVEAKRELAIADSLLDEQKRLIDAKQMRQVEFTEVVKHFETARSIARTESVRGEADRGLKRYKDLAVLWEATKAQIVAQEEAKARALEDARNKPVDTQKGYTMSGFIDTTGLLWKRPGTHKLVMGGKIVCFLRVKDGDEKMTSRLNDCYQKYVGVNGTIIRNPDGWDGYSVVVVEEVAPLQEPK